MNLKRDNWTNEEVIQSINNLKIPYGKAKWVAEWFMKKFRRLFKRKENPELAALRAENAELKYQVKFLTKNVESWNAAWHDVRSKFAHSVQYFYLLGYRDKERGFTNDSRRDLLTLSREEIKELLKQKSH